MRRALAGAGNGTDEPKPDEAARAKLREQAFAWLKAELSALTRPLASADARARAGIMQNLVHWQADPDLAGVRDTHALEKLLESGT